MAMHATVTSKGRVTIPKPIRNRLHLEPGDKIDFILDEAGDLLVTPVTVPVARLKGMVPKPGSPVRLEKMDEAIARGAARKR